MNNKGDFMDGTLKTLVNVYKMQDIDWLGYKLEDRFSYHHIIKKCDGGERTFNNGAVLFQTSHAYLHTIEYYDLDKYVFINKILKDINNQRYMPTKIQMKQINYVLKEFQREYEDKENSRGVKIIKKEYIKNRH